MPTPLNPRAGEVWDVEFSPTVGREQSERRPGLVISNDAFNDLRNTFHIVVPITGTDRGLVYHHRIATGEGGLIKDSVLLCDHVRSVSVERFYRKRGSVTEETLAQVRRIVDLFTFDDPPYRYQSRDR